MTSVGLLTISDGRPSVHEEVTDFSAGVENRIAGRLEESGYTVIRGREQICNTELAVTEARRIADARPALTIINIPVWAFPHFTMRAVREIPGPVMLFSNVDPQYPGMVGMLAAAGALDQVQRGYGRAWGDIRDASVWGRVEAHIRAGAAAEHLRGSTFGRFGGRAMGMYTAVSNGDRWLRQFGVDVEEIDQWEIVRRAEEIDGARVTAARQWLEQHSAGVHYDGKLLTPELLERQIRSYYVVRQIIEEMKLDFCGIKGQPELTNNFVTMDVTEAFLNDPYDWDGPKQPFVCSTEADMDAALTMQILTSLSDTPVLFADMRHYDAELGIWDLCNSGQHATWFAARSDDPLENMSKVHLYPEDFYFPAGGASVHHLAAPGAFTFARLYRMQVLKGDLEQFDAATNERLMKASTFVWPHAFARFTAGVEDVLARYGSNHIHAVPGDHVAALHEVCLLLDVDFDPIGAL
jgi:L-fucose/D-arabinose isomerase